VTVRGAGVGVAFAAVLAGLIVLFVEDVAARQWIALLVGSAAFGVLGLLDDTMGGIGARWRLGAQAALAVALAAGLVADLDPPLWLLIAVPAGAVWIVAYVNAFNFMDGINGISGISAFIAGAAFAAMGLVLEDLVLTIAGSVVAGASLGFLPFNFPRARAFLGDSGSYFLGTWLGASAILVIRAGGAPWSAIAPLSLYLADTGWTIILRARRGENLLSAHRSHVYQRLATDPGRHVTVAVLVGLITASLSVIGVAIVDAKTPIQAIGVIVSAVILVVYVWLPVRLDRCRRRVG